LIDESSLKKAFVTTSEIPATEARLPFKGRPINNLLIIDGRETQVLKVAEYWNDGMVE
jgi:hypothetical protein